MRNRIIIKIEIHGIVSQWRTSWNPTKYHGPFTLGLIPSWSGAVKKYESIVVQLEKANENIFSLESNKNLEESPAKKRIVLNNSDRDRLEIGLNCVSDYRRSSRIKKINSSMNIIAE